MSIQVILAVIAGLMALIAVTLTLLTLMGVYKPDVRAVYVQTCVILLWLLSLIISQARVSTNAITQHPHPAIKTTWMR